MSLGAIFSVSFLIVLGFRPTARRRYVQSADETGQAGRAFMVDFVICVTAGILAAVYNRIVHGFVLSSAGSIVIGSSVAGFFIGLDAALTRERELIRVKTGWHPGDVILIGTDGIHETRNEADEMYGGKRLRDLLLQSADLSSEGIKDAVITSLEAFRGGAPLQDDITLVVAKLL